MFPLFPCNTSCHSRQHFNHWQSTEAGSVIRNDMLREHHMTFINNRLSVIFDINISYW